MEMKKRIGELLIEAGLITKEQLDMALEQQKRTKQPIGAILVNDGFCQDTDIAQTIAFQLNIKYIDIASTAVEPEALQLIPERIAAKYNIMPLYLDKTSLTVAMVDPLNLLVMDELAMLTRCHITPTVSTAREIEAAIRRHYHLSDALIDVAQGVPSAEGMVEVVQEAETSQISDDIKKSELPPIIKLVNSIVINAINSRASDIHIEPQAKEIRLRERVDGVMSDISQFPKWIQGAVTSRIKIMAKLDITEKRVPQDGRIKVRMDEREIEFRVSTLPSQYGENIVMRILDAKSSVLGLEQIGLVGADINIIKSMVRQPHGIILVTGPTGSGKSSTLYSMINSIKSPKINIITLEDPIEYELKGITQVAINEKTGLTFAYGLRSILRQDPDVIMVGEIRDSETAGIAIQSSLTGHLVISTLHTNDTVSSITRLKDIGVPSYLTASSLNGIIAQRLARRICDSCKEQYMPSSAELNRLGIKQHNAPFFRGSGCAKCNHTGYRGRVGLFEILSVDRAIKELIRNDASEETIRKASVERGMLQLKDDGIRKAKEGMTTVDELMRVLFVEREEDSGAAQCPNCREQLKAGALACPACGFKLKESCPACGKGIDPTWLFCPHCGGRLKPAHG